MVKNLYDENTPSGNWGIDKTLAILMEQEQGNIIIVTIDHGAKERIIEYTPIENLEKVRLLKKVLETQLTKNNEVHLSINLEGIHNGACRKAEFGKAITWLF